MDHPRWSQATERRLGEFRKRPTLMFNGYGDQVASLYTGMDLKKILLTMLRNRWTKILVFLLCLAPVFWLGWRAWNDDLTANPIEFITHFTGDWTIRMIVITLAVTPLRKLLGLPDLIRFRRMIGLFAFFYGCLHFMTYLWLDKFFDMHEIVKDIGKRPFITAGFAAFLCMVPLALTSTKGWIRRLGGKRWQLLHRLVYVSGDRGRGSLLLAGEVGRPPAAALRHAGGRPAAVPDRRVGCQAPGARRPEAPGRPWSPSHNRLMRLLLAALLPLLLPAADLKIDHATVAGADLKKMQANLEAAGIRSVYGGAHNNRTTEMALVSFPDGSYLELMAQQPGADPKLVDRNEWARYLKSGGTPCAWAVREADIAAEVQRLRAAGIEVSAAGTRRPRPPRRRPPGMGDLQRRPGNAWGGLSLPHPRPDASHPACLSGRQARDARLPRHHPRSDRRRRSRRGHRPLPQGLRPAAGHQAGG